jgi:PAS domain S-box-containing protein
MANISLIDVIGNNSNLSILQYVPNPILIYNHDQSNFVFINNAAIDLYGYSARDFERLQISDIQVKKIPEGSNSKNGALFEHMNKNGDPIYVKVQSKLIENNGEKVILYSMNDITDSFSQNILSQRNKALLNAIAEVNSSFILNADWLRALQKCLAIIGKTIHGDRVYFFDLKIEDEKKVTASQIAEWCLEDVSPQIDNEELQNLDLTPFRFFTEALFNKKPFDQKVTEISHKEFKGLLESQNIKSILFHPVFSGEKVHGFIGIDACFEERSWKKDEIELVKSFSTTIAGTIDKQLALKSVQLSKDRFKAMVRESTDIITMIDREGNFTYVGDTILSILNISPDWLNGKNAFDFIHPNDVKYVKNFLTRVFNEEKRVKIPAFRFIDGEGKWRWISSVITNLSNDEAVKGVVANTRDITKEKEYSLRLEKANDRYRIAAQVSDEHIYDWDVAGNKIIQSGDSFKRIFGFELNNKELITRDFWIKHLSKAESDKLHKKQVKAFKNKKVKTVSFNYQLKNPDGSTKQLLDTARLFRDDKGRVTRVVGSVKDITPVLLKKTEDKLLQSLSGLLGKASNLSEGILDMLELLSRFSKTQIAEYWSLTADGAEIHLTQSYTRDKSGELFHKDSNNIRSFSFEFHNSTTVEKWCNEEIVIWDNLGENKDFVRRNSAKKVGLKSGIGVPIIHNKSLLGVFILLADKPKNNWKNIQKLLSNLTEQLGPIINQKRIQEELNSFFELSPDILAITNNEGILRKTNIAFQEILGYNQQEVINQSIFNFTHEDDYDKINDALGDVENELIELRARFISKSNEEKWLNWRFRYNKDSKQVYAVAKDITARQKVRLQLQETLEKLKNAQDIANLGYWNRSLDQEKIEWSDEVYRIYDYEIDAITPTHDLFLEHMAVDDRPEFMLLFEKMLKKPDGGSEYEFTHRIITSTNEVKWVYQKMKVITDEKGDATFLEGIIQDITERKQYEELLRMSNERFELAMKSTNEMIWDWNHLTNEVSRGFGYQKEYGYKTTEKVTSNNSWFNLIHPDDREQVYNSINHVLDNTREDYWYEEYRIIKPNGKVAYILDRAYILRNENGEAIRSVGASLDATVSRKQMYAIKKQNETLKEVAWIQSHVIRAPIVRIMGMLDLIEQQYKSIDPDLKEQLEVLAKSAQELDDLTRDITKKTESIDY